MKDVPESVKSGYLLEKFRMFHLNDSKPREYEYHYHDFHKLIWFISGEVEYHIEGKAYHLRPHDILLINSGQIHRPVIDTAKPYERYVFYISREFLKEHSEEDAELDVSFQLSLSEDSSVVRLSPTDSGRLFETVQLLEKEMEGREFFGREMYNRILFLKLIMELNRCCVEDQEVFHKTAHYDKKIVEIIHYINDHLAGELTIDKLAADFYISKYHMMRKFKEETGYSVHQYVLEKRILAAKKLIVEGVPATTAALECGFQDYSTFSRAYKKLLQQPPSQTGNINIG